MLIRGQTPFFNILLKWGQTPFFNIIDNFGRPDGVTRRPG